MLSCECKLNYVFAALLAQYTILDPYHAVSFLVMFLVSNNNNER